MVRNARATSLGAVAMAWLFTSSCPAEARPPCDTKITRDDVVACALGTSPELRGERLGIEAMQGRKEAQETILPSNPSLSLGLGKRTASTLEPGSWIWSASLAQEIEIGGQRGARLEVANGELEAQRKRTDATRLELATAALDAYFDVLAAREQKHLAEALARVAKALSESAHARAEAGLFAPMDADIAEAAGLRIAQEGFAAERRLASTQAKLAAMVGAHPAAPPIEVEGELLPLPVPLSLEPLLAQALTSRADLKALEAEERAQSARITLYSRRRIPNPTISVFAESERPDEHRFGVGLSFPIPLPAPIGQTYRGEIAEATALAARASAEAEALRRNARLETATALETFLSRRREVDAFPEDLLLRARQDLDALALEVEAGRLAVRDALVAQQSLIELLRAFIDARHQLCLASVELVRAASLPIHEVNP